MSPFSKPLVFIFYLGAADTVISARPRAIPIVIEFSFALQVGWASVIVSIWMLGV